MNGQKYTSVWLTLILLTPGIIDAQGTAMQDSLSARMHSILLTDQVERTTETLEADNDLTGLIEELSDPAIKPVNLNNTTEDELKRIPFLSPTQQKELEAYLKAYGDVLTIFELISIPGFDSSLILKVQPYISITPHSSIPRPTPKNLLKLGHNLLILRYEQTFPGSVGYHAGDSARSNNLANVYPGSPQKYYFRYTYTWFDRIKAGLAGEKDPGEQFFRGPQRTGMDYYAGYLSLSNIGILKNLIVGNYKVAFGQGVTIGSGVSLNAAPGFSIIPATHGGIRPSLAMNEGSYLRGLAATIKIKHAELSVFFSFHPQDATARMYSKDSVVAGEVSSLNATGYHRTALELSKKNAMNEMVYGGNVNFSLSPNQQFGFKIGLTGLSYSYTSKLFPDLYPYNRYYFRGKANVNAGLDFQFRAHGLYLFGEVGRSRNAGMAWITGATLSPDPRVSMMVICRNYGVDYQNAFSHAFGQSSQTSNERGLFASINAMPGARWNLSGYIDLFTFPWLRYRVDTPARGNETGLCCSYQPNRDVLINLKFYQKHTRINGAAAPGQRVHKLLDYRSLNYRFGLECHVSGTTLLKTRIDVKKISVANVHGRSGYVISQEAQVKPMKFLETATIRFSLFDIPGYDSRIYICEPDVLYGFSAPAYQGHGIRACLVLKLGIMKQLDLWVRGGIEYYTDRQVIGSGLDQIKGNVREELTAQVLVGL